MKKLLSGLMVLVLAMFFSVSSQAVEGDLFVQVDCSGLTDDGCSIMQVTPAGVISQFVSNAQILAATGESVADCTDTGLAVAENGDVYFSEDESDSILMVTAAGVVSVFVTEAALDAVVGETVDLDSGMAIGPHDGNLYVADENSDSILKIIIGGPGNGLVTQIITKAQFDALLPLGDTPSLEGGIAVDFEGSIYISDDNNDLIYKWDETLGTGVLRILSTAAQIMRAAGPNPDLDVGVVFGGDLFVLDDGGCDCLLRIHPVTGDATVLVSEASIIAATGNGNADVEGGLAIDMDQNLCIGDDGNLGADTDRPSIVLGTQAGTASLSVSTTDIRGLYDVVEPDCNPQLRGSMSIHGMFDFPPSSQVLIPTLSEWGLIAMAAILGIVGFIVARRRMVKA
ncbi:MAG: IPTL-CTERM sorting domain-containing protein [Candidatus Dadabacteria bacterium]|nr:IPTL-CTERM sorting domain-containing protein [Candidatus Dadabacteria bacterium]